MIWGDFMSYIVALDAGLYCFYYRDGGVWFCEYQNNAWKEARELISEAREDFTVNLVGNGPLLIWHDNEGNLKRGRFSGDSIAAELLIKGKGDLGQYCAVPADGGMNLVYTLPFSGDVHMLMSQFVGASGAWGAVRRVDNIGVMANGLFRLVPVSERHFLAVYQNGGFESRIGYKEIYRDEVGKYNLIHSSIHSFGDCSFLATTHDLHVACVVRGVFGSRLLYKKKGEDGFSPGVVVAEGQGLHNVVLYMVGEKLHLLFMRNDTMYCVVAEEDGYRWSFLPLEERGEERPGQLAKAVFLTGNKRDFAANELLVDKERPWEIQAVSEYVTRIYAQNVQVQDVENTKTTEEDYNKFFNDMEIELMEFLE